MKKYKGLLLCYAIIGWFAIGYAQDVGRSKINFGSGWEFKREEPAANWEKVNLPHTAKIESLVVVKQFQGVSQYRKTFYIPKITDQYLALYFEGIMQEAQISINGKTAASHKGGYLPFTVDLTNLVKGQSDNTITITVKNTDNPEVPPGKPIKDLDFNYYGGIYRNAWLITTSKLHITNAIAANKVASGGLYLKFDSISPSAAKGNVKLHLKNDFPAAKMASVRLTFIDAHAKTSDFESAPIQFPANSNREIDIPIQIDAPLLWSVNDPNLYTLKAEVYLEGKLADTKLEKIGIRKSELKPDGYYLNGKKLFIAGTNRHQEYPYVGYAISDDAQYRDAVKIKNAGFDFVRLSHYPQAEAFLDACDALGILVMNSIPGWQFFGNEKFQENSIQTIRDMARRDRNHPSVVFWEASLNESEMTPSYMEKANAVLREELPGRDHYTAGWIDNAAYDLYIPARQHGKAPDYWTKYDKANRKIFIAEYGDWEYYAQNAGFSQKEFANLKEEERTSRQLRGFGEKRLLQQAFNFAEASNSNRKGKATIGEANWLMFDYNRGYSPDIESSGISDIFRIPKFAYDFYRSQRDAKPRFLDPLHSGPMVSIASYWTPTSNPKVTVFSNCDEVALSLNGNLIARQKPTITAASDALAHPSFVFDTKAFVAGTLMAEGFIDGQKMAEVVVETPGKPAKIILQYDQSSRPINPDFPDVVFVYAKIADANATVIPDSVLPVTFHLDGAEAALVGQNPMPAEAGISTILLRTEKFKKTITITATAPGIEPAKLTLNP